MTTHPPHPIAEIDRLIAQRSRVRRELFKLNARIRKARQALHIDKDLWTAQLSNHISHPNVYTTADLLEHCLRIPRNRQDARMNRRASRIMRSLGWSNVVTKTPDRRSVRVWKYFHI